MGWLYLVGLKAQIQASQLDRMLWCRRQELRGEAFLVRLSRKGGDWMTTQKYKVKVDMENLMKGTLVEVPPIGRVENGSTAEVEMTRDAAEYLASAYGIEV